MCCGIDLNSPSGRDGNNALATAVGLKCVITGDHTHCHDSCGVGQTLPVVWTTSSSRCLYGGRGGPSGKRLYEYHIADAMCGPSLSSHIILPFYVSRWWGWDTQIINQDVFSLELLLNTTNTLASSSNGENDDDTETEESPPLIYNRHLTLACRIGDTAITQLLYQHLYPEGPIHHLSFSGATNAYATGMICPPKETTSVLPAEETGTLWEETWREEENGYLDIGLLPPVPTPRNDALTTDATTDKDKGGGASFWSGLSQSCALDVVSVENGLSPLEFVEKYVRMRRPVLLRGWIDPEIRKW